MFVQFRVNLGSADAAALKLDYRRCQLGMKLNVDDAEGEWLINHGIAIPAVGAPKEPTIKGVKDSDGK